MPLTGQILIVDDEPHVRLYLTLIVRTLGQFEVTGASNGHEGLATYRTFKDQPALIMLDVNMPGIDGIETLRLLRAAGATCPIVMLTSLATRQRVEEAITSGADHYIRKDTPRADIIFQLKSVLDDSADLDDPAAPPPAKSVS